MTRAPNPLRRITAQLPTTPRPCLGPGCTRDCLSTGRHHRLCEPCRASQAVNDTETDDAQWTSPTVWREKRRREMVARVGEAVWG